MIIKTSSNSRPTCQPAKLEREFPSRTYMGAVSQFKERLFRKEGSVWAKKWWNCVSMAQNHLCRFRGTHLGAKQTKMGLKISQKSPRKVSIMARHLRSQDAEEQITVCDDEATAPEHSISCAQSTEPVLASPPKKRHPNHHVGPIDLSYEEDSQRRCKSFFKRRKTIFDKANQLTSICGASVSIMLKSQAGHLYEYRSGEFQPDGVAGMPMISVQQGPTPRGRPRKTPAKSKNGESEQDEQAGTCSSSSACHQPIGKKTPCAVCKKRNTWLACQKPGCNFWAHARCLGFVALAPTDMSNVKFFCPKHIPAS